MESTLFLLKKIVYRIGSVADVIACKSVSFLFTDGHVSGDLSSCFLPDRINEIEQLIDRKAVNSRYWRDEIDLDLRRRKEAEFLVLGDLPAVAIRGYIVYNNTARAMLLDLGIAVEKVVVKPEHYF